MQSTRTMTLEHYRKMGSPQTVADLEEMFRQHPLIVSATIASGDPNFPIKVLNPYREQLITLQEFDHD